MIFDFVSSLNNVKVINLYYRMNKILKFYKLIPFGCMLYCFCYNKTTLIIGIFYIISHCLQIKRVYNYCYNKMVSCTGDKFVGYNDMVVNHSFDSNAPKNVVYYLKLIPLSILKEYAKYGGKIYIRDECYTVNTRFYKKKCGGYFSFEKSGHPYIEIQASYPEAVVHEFGHFVDAVCRYKFNSIKFIIAFYIERWQYVIRNYIFDPKLFNSFYYQRRQEWFAESFRTYILWSGTISLDCIKRTNNIIINCINEINDKHKDH